MKKIRINIAGIDIGAKEFFVGLEGQEVKSFFTFTEEIENLIKYLKKTQNRERCYGSYRCLLVYPL